MKKNTIKFELPKDAISISKNDYYTFEQYENNIFVRSYILNFINELIPLFNENVDKRIRDNSSCKPFPIIKYIEDYHGNIAKCYIDENNIRLAMKNTKNNEDCSIANLSSENGLIISKVPAIKINRFQFEVDFE